MVTCLACEGTDVDRWAAARDVEYHSVPERFEYVHCRACDALSITPVPRERLREIYPANYYSFAASSAGAVYRVKNRLDEHWFRRITRGIRGPTLSALDVGGGAGEQLSTLRAADPRITRSVVVDMDEGARDAALARGHEYVLGRFEDAAATGPFDVILLLNLIEHVEHPRAVLEKVRALLAPGGVALVKTPNHASLDARVFRHRNWGGYHCPRHWVIFTAASFQRLATAAGLRTLRWSYTQGAPFWTVSVLSWLRDRHVIRVDARRPAWGHPLYGPLAAAFAAFDFARRPFSPLSQMTFELARQ